MQRPYTARVYHISELLPWLEAMYTSLQEL